MPHPKRRNDLDGKIAGLYDLGETIGEGHFAVVKLAKHVFTGEKVAVKVIDKTKLDDVSKSHLFQEVRCMKLVQHPNVVRLYEVIDTHTKLYLILELGDGGDMYDYIMKHEAGLEESKARHYFRQIVEAISYCHKLHVVHRDLKPENVVFFKTLGVVKLTDFGFSNMFNPGNKLETSCGSLAYSAPEILLGDSYDAPAVDIWSLGVILYMLVCGKPPFQEVSDSETLTMIMDCKYDFPTHISDACKQLISVMLRREPGHRANLSEIENHCWLAVDGEDVPHHHMPLISREQVSEEDHVCVIEKMVEGCIANKEDILHSLEKDMYDHITATYYLLVERRLRKHQQDLVNQAALSQVRKHSAPSAKPHLEPLALSPRKQREIKKTKTVPVTKNLSQMLAIPESPPSVEDSGGMESRTDYFKSLTTSMTLDRREKRKPKKPVKEATSAGVAISPRLGRPSFPVGPAMAIPVVHEPVTQKRKLNPLSKIAILSSFFEGKIAALSSSGDSEKKAGFWKLPGFRRKKSRVKQRGLPDFNLETPASNCDCVMSKEAESTDERKQAKQAGLVLSLLSPPGTHPAPSTSLREGSASAPARNRKCSLIKEESLEEGAEGDEEDMEYDMYDKTLGISKSAEFLDIDDDDRRYEYSSPVKETEQMMIKRPLLSVASSPQLLNQICEENESEEEDFVPAKLNPSRLMSQRNSLASPELIRKYEARKKRRGAGSRGASCSSSDASDTDDTEGRSRKDKLKHKFVHRRDSSDHSSDTDGGPSGHGGTGFGKGLGGGGSNGNGPSRGGDDKGGGGSGKKDGKGGSPKSGRSHHRGKQNSLNFKLGGEVIPGGILGRKSEKSGVGGGLNVSLASLNSKTSLKYVLERDENVSDSDAEDNGDDIIEKENIKNSHVSKLSARNCKLVDKDLETFSNLSENNRSETKLNGRETESGRNCSQECDILSGQRRHGSLSVKMDINSNISCKQDFGRVPVTGETKCCSVV